MAQLCLHGLYKALGSPVPRTLCLVVHSYNPRTGGVEQQNQELLVILG